MRDFMTPELYAAIEAQVAAAGNAPQETAVVKLDAEVLEVVTEGASVYRKRTLQRRDPRGR